VGKVPMIKSVTPTETAVSYPTAFIADVNWSKSIATYVWDFGDGNMQNTTISEVAHTYDTIGNYGLKLTVYDSAGKSASKIFQIKVSSASEVVPSLLIDAEANLATITSEIADLTSFERDSVNASLNLDLMRSTLAELQNQALTAATEEDFGAILTGLISLNIPQEIARTTFSDELTFYTQPENINIDALVQIGGGNYSLEDGEKYKEAVLFWDEQNIDSKLTYSEISSIFADREESILKEFTIRIINKGSGEGTRYFIIKDLENLRFDKDYSEQRANGYVYFPLSGQDSSISFTTTEEIDFISLPLFVSPAITELTIIENPSPFKSKNNGWIIFLLAMLVILIAGAVWFIIHIWYKRKYETFLFKNRNNLYNLINFIGSEKKKGAAEKDIFAKLRKSGWSGEQLRYAFKKYAGKNKWEKLIEKIFHKKPKAKSVPPKK
jgi:PKD repeat protein